MDLEKTANAIKTITEAIPIYQDGLQPAVQELGKALHTVARAVNVALAPVKGLVWGYDQLEHFLSTKVAQKLENTPTQDIISPPTYVAGPALEALRFSGHEESLQNLYANLLAASMDAATVQAAHPAFVEILKQISPDEARLLELLSKPAPFPVLSLRNEDLVAGKGGIDMLMNFSLLGEKSNCNHPQLTPSYLSNLSRLGIIEIPPFFHYTDEGVYKEVESHPTVMALKEQIENQPGRKAEITRQGIRITPLGNQFIVACVMPHDESRNMLNL